MRGPGDHDRPVIRPAGAEDVPVLASLARAAYARYVPRLGREPAPMNADYASLVAAGRVWVAELDRLVGLLVLDVGPDHVFIANIAVDPDAQGRGIGGALLDHAEAEGRRAGLAQLVLYTNVAMTENRAWYARHGYREVGEEAEGSFRRVRLAKPVPPA